MDRQIARYMDRQIDWVDIQMDRLVDEKKDRWK